MLPELESCLTKNDTPLMKLKKWRHDAVAHDAADRTAEFHTDNRMTLTEIEGALTQLESLLNHLSWNILAIHNDTRNGFESLVEDGKSLFACAAAGIRNAASDSEA